MMNRLNNGNGNPFSSTIYMVSVLRPLVCAIVWVVIVR